MKKLTKVLFLVLALCVMISIMSIAATAGDNPVARVGETEYTSLADAIAAAQAGDTIELIADDYSLSDGAMLTIDKALTITGAVDDEGAPLYTIYGCETLTEVGNDLNTILVTGSGNVTLSNLNIRQFGNHASTNIDTASVYAASAYTGKLTLKNLNITDFNRTGVILNGGTFEIADCLIDANNSMNDAITYGIDVDKAATGSITGTTVRGMSNNYSNWSTACISINGTGAIEITDCTVEYVDLGIAINSGSSVVTLNGTHVEKAAVTHGQSLYALYNCTGTGTFTVNSGFYEGYIGYTSPVTPSTATIYSGYFTSKYYAPNLVAAGSVWVDGNPDRYVEGAPSEGYRYYVAPAVAQIGTTKYASLEDAIAAVKTAASSERTTITLLADTNEVPVIDFTYPVQINGQGHKLGLGGASAGYAMRITAVGADVIIDNTVVGSMSVGRGINVNASGVTLVVQNNSEVYGSSYPINVYANQSGITVDNNHITITNSTIKGYCALNLWGANGVVDVTGSTLWGENNASYSPNNNEFGAIALEGLSDTPGATGYTVNVTNTTIKVTSTKGNEQYPVVFNPNSSNNTVYLTSCTIDRENATLYPLVHDEGISGNKTYVKGTTDSTTSATPVLPSGYNYCEAADGYKLVGTAVAKIGEATYYTSLAEAIAAAQAGDTIEIIADDNVSLTNGGELEIDKSLTINGNGFTVYGTPDQTGTNDIFITGSGTVSINDLNVEGFGYNCSTDPAHAPIYVSTGFTGTVNLSGVSISRFNRGGLFLYGGTFHVEDCTIDCANSRSGAFTKGIEIKGAATGTIANTMIFNMERSGSDSVAGIELYGTGSVLVDGCTILSDDTNHQSVKATYGIVSSRVGVHDPSGGSLTVKDTTINVSNAALSVADSDEYGPVNGYTMIVEDCTFANYVATWSASSSITLKSGDFAEDVYVDAGTIYIEGGNFTNFAPDGNVVITGGTFDADPTAYVAEGYKAVDNGDGTWTVAPADVYTAAASAATGNLSLGGSGSTFRFTITKNGTKLTKTAEYSAEKDNWELVYDPEYIELTNTSVSGSGIGYTVKALKAGETTITFRNKADNTITASTVLTNNHAVSITYNRGADVSNGNKYLLEKGTLTITKIKFDGVEYTGADLDAFLESHTLTVEGNATIDGLNVTPNATGNVYIHVTENEDATVTARSGLLNFINAVAQIGNDYYATLTAAFKAAQNGDTITLISDITEYVSFGGTAPRATEFALTLDLNGHTFTAPADKDFALRVQYGVITIKDSVGTGAIRYGKNSAILVDHLAGDYPSKVIIESGTFTGKSTVVQTGYPGGYGTNYKYYGGELEVLGGTFVTVADTNENYDANGNFRYTLNMLDMNASAYAGGIYSPSSIIVKGGTFNGFDPANNAAEGENTNFVAEGYESVELTTGTWTVDQIKVAQIGTTKYASLEEAFAAAQNGNTITLLNDVSVSETVEITKSITLDGCNHTLTTTATRGIWIDSSNVNVTIKNMEIVSSNNKMERSIQVNPDCDGVTLNLNNITTTATYYTVNICGDVDNLVLNIENSNLTGWGVINLWGNNGTVRIEDSILTGINDKGYNAEGWNDFGVIIAEGDTTGQTTEHVYDYDITVVDTTIASSTTTGNHQYTILYNNPSAVNRITLVGCTITLGDENCSFFLDEGTSNVTKVKNTYLPQTTTRPELPEGYLYAPCGEDYYLITKAVAQINETKYASLAAAIAAANADTTSDSITITLLKDIDFSTEEYAGYKWAGSTYNPLTITRSNVTIDLDGHTISEMGNAALVFGNLLAKDGRIANITIKNGTLRAGKTDNVTNSYVLGIAGVDGVLVKDITTLGGINVYTGSKNVVIENCNVAGTKYYTVCAQCGSDVTIKGTTYTKNTDSTVANKSMFWIQGAGSDSDMITDENPTGAFGTSSITIESGNFTVDTSNGGVFYLSSGVKPIVKGGYFNIDPTAYVADGYAAVTSDLAGYTHKVVPYVEQSTTTAEATTTTTDEQSGTTTTTTTTTNLATAESGDNTQYVIKVETTVTTSTTGSDETTEQTNTTYKPVNVAVASNNNVDEHVEVTAENLNASTGTIEGAKDTVEAVTSQAATFEAKLDENGSASSANVLKTTAAANAIAKAAATVSAEDTENITDAKIELKTTLKSYTLADDNTTNAVVATKVVYDIKPVAVIYNGSTKLSEAVELDNADIKEGETFTFTIPVPANMTATTVKVSHIGTNGYSTEIGTYGVQGTGSNRYVTVTVDHFSEFELEEAAVSIDGSCKVSATISLNDSIDIHLFVKELASGTSASDYKVVYSFNGEEEKTVLGCNWEEVENTGRYYFNVASCAAKQMNDEVNFYVYYFDDELNDWILIKSVEGYSIRQYCVNQINNSTKPVLVSLCRAVLDYGAEAQEYFNYNKANLANAGGYGLTSKETSVPADYNIANAEKAPDVTRISATLNTVSKTEIYVLVSTTSQVNGVSGTYGEEQPISDQDLYFTHLDDGRWLITVKGIAATYLDREYSIIISTDEGNTLLNYSALSYTYNKQIGPAGAISLAIYNYYLNAVDYFNSINQ